MPALLLDIDRVFVRVRIREAVHHRVSVLGRSSGLLEYRLIIERDLGLRQVVHPVAGGLAGAATDASGQIGQNAEAILVSGELPGCVGRLRFARQAGA
jgi:hypothetical protein